MRHLLRVRNAAQLVCVTNPTAPEPFLCGAAQNTVHVIANGTVVVGADGKIVGLGTAGDAAFEAQFEGCEFDMDVDATGKCCLPGLVDAHTHPVWSGDRVHEFAMKLEGASYMDIHKAGGGIHYTVQCVRDSAPAELSSLLSTRLDRMLRQGTTLVEAKTGYGLDLDTELKMLRVLNAVAKDHSVEVVPTFLSAHAVPKGGDAEACAADIAHRHIPELKKLVDSGEVQCTNVDVFCEQGVYSTPQSQRILEAARAHDFLLNFHGDELHPTHSAEMGAALGARAISHLEEISKEGIAAMAEAKSCAVLLPTTAHLLHLSPPPAREMIACNVPVALGSDFNPNAHCLSMPFVMNLACVQLRLTMREALVGATINAAYSMGCEATHGSLAMGKMGDLVLLDAPSWEHVAYQLVDPPIQAVFKKGKLVSGSA